MPTDIQSHRPTFDAMDVLQRKTMQWAKLWLKMHCSNFDQSRQIKTAKKYIIFHKEFLHFIQTGSQHWEAWVNGMEQDKKKIHELCFFFTFIALFTKVFWLKL